MTTIILLKIIHTILVKTITTVVVIIAIPMQIPLDAVVAVVIRDTMTTIMIMVLAVAIAMSLVVLDTTMDMEIVDITIAHPLLVVQIEDMIIMTISLMIWLLNGGEVQIVHLAVLVGMTILLATLTPMDKEEYLRERVVAVEITTLPKTAIAIAMPPVKILTKMIGMMKMMNGSKATNHCTDVS